MYSYPFCPSRVHRWGQGWVGVSLAALAAPAVQASASSQMGLSYVLQAAVCSQREPFLGINGAGRPPSASSCLALLTSTSSSFPIPSVCIFCSPLGWLCMVQVGSTRTCGQQLLCMSLASLPGFPRVSPGLSFSSGTSTTSWPGLSSLFLGQLRNMVSKMAKMSFNTHLGKPLEVSLRRAVSPLDNPDSFLIPAYLEFSMCFDLKQRKCLFHNWQSICYCLIIFDIIYFGLLSDLCCFLMSSSFFTKSLI